MTITEALTLAREIATGTTFELIAVGRFVSVSEIHRDLPWGCSVRLAGESTTRVVWSPEELAALLPEPEPAPIEDHQPAHQLSLF